MLLPGDRLARCDVYLGVEPCGHQGRDRWPLYYLYRGGREAQNVLSHARNRAPFHNDGCAPHKCSEVHSTTRKDPALPAACAYVIPALAAVLPLANGQLAYFCFTSLSSQKKFTKKSVNKLYDKV